MSNLGLLNMPRTNASDPGDQKLLDDIKEFGWHCLSVDGDDEHQQFTYTIGLFQTFGFPELLIYGLDGNIAHEILTIAGNAAARGEPLNTSEPTDALLEGYSCVFVRVPIDEYPDHVGFARWYYECDSFPVEQIVWPSKAGLFPWHAEAPDAFRTKQPVLGRHKKGT